TNSSKAAPSSSSPVPTLGAGVGTQWVFAIGTDDQVWAETARGGQRSGTVKAISAVTDGGGHPEVFAIAMDDQVWPEACNPSSPWDGWALAQNGRVLQRTR